jgi:hypothetical protein
LDYLIGLSLRLAFLSPQDFERLYQQSQALAAGLGGLLRSYELQEHERTLRRPPARRK